jgi:hypothetical protein
MSPWNLLLNVTMIAVMACEQVDLASVPFQSFISNKGQDGGAATYSFVLRGYVRHWLGNVWAEYDRAHLSELVSEPARKPKSQS